MGATVVTDCDTSPILEFGEEVLDLVVLFVERLVIGVWRFPASA